MIYTIIGFVMGAVISLILAQISDTIKDERNSQRHRLRQLEEGLRDVTFDVKLLKDRIKSIETREEH